MLEADQTQPADRYKVGLGLGLGAHSAQQELLGPEARGLHCQHLGMQEPQEPLQLVLAEPGIAGGVRHQVKQDAWGLEPLEAGPGLGAEQAGGVALGRQRELP